MFMQYATVGIFLIAGIIFGFGALFANWLLRPKPKNAPPAKLEAYECGMETIGPTWVQFRINYFIIALVFMVFDVETIFLYPWAIAFQKLGLFAFIEMFVFLAILVVGFWYALKEGAFEWR
ncbi:MAG: NADH-quinone oxidoreductase subunit A [Peptococcaceae bacterium]|nr:NADH-quinone oxidoreductase subunit A [Peptococcaceae bacterium]MDH7525686.1 NADH-quinone oxidoreductase subunit A [Peptococcaceae bacterium]